MEDSTIEHLSSIIDANAARGSLIDLPDDAPFDPLQRQWLNGLLTGLSTIAAAANSGREDTPGTPLKILYGSQSGNCEVLAKDLRKYAAGQGFEPDIAELDTLAPTDLVGVNHLLIICSTFGEGEPPDNAKKFYAALMAADAPALPADLNFSVCGLGDSSYTHFNKAAEDIFARMVALGATPAQELISCDLSFEDDYAGWKQAVFSTDVFTQAAGAATVSDTGNEPPEPLFNKNRPFLATLIDRYNLSGERSAKRVNHIEISLAGGGEDLNYQVGDALGVWPINCPREVDELLAAGGFTGRELVEQKNGSASLRVLLQTKLDIHTVNAKTRTAWGIADSAEPTQVADLLTTLNPSLTAQQFADGLRPLQPRLYSIASSPKKHPGEVHLTVGEVHYPLLDKARKGVASTWLGHRLPPGANLGVYVQPSAHFHITPDDQAPVIMIGPGTGIAPFRAFLEEREMRAASGKNWLFFGDQHQDQDFLYREQIGAWQDSGLLTELSLAWSRDSAEKIYVQTLIKQQGEMFYQWLEEGAYLYICGDASRMAADVDTAIREVIAEHGGFEETDVENYMSNLVDAHRYQRDVY